MRETILADEVKPGEELLHIQGPPGYETEELMIVNSQRDGLRVDVYNDEQLEWAMFHVHTPETAWLIGERLIEWSKRIGNPPSQH